jgi:hypothetical protein
MHFFFIDLAVNWTSGFVVARGVVVLYERIIKRKVEKKIAHVHFTGQPSSSKLANRKSGHWSVERSKPDN